MAEWLVMFDWVCWVALLCLLLVILTVLVVWVILVLVVLIWVLCALLLLFDLDYLFAVWVFAIYVWLLCLFWVVVFDVMVLLLDYCWLWLCLVWGLYYVFGCGCLLVFVCCVWCVGFVVLNRLVCFVLILLDFCVVGFVIWVFRLDCCFVLLVAFASMLCWIDV